MATATVSIGLTGTPAAGDAFYADDLELRPANSDVGTRVLASSPPGTAYNDWGAASGTDYEYRWVTQGGNGTSGFGPWVG